MPSIAPRSLIIALAIGPAVVVAPATARGQAEFERMMWLVPDSANALALVRSSALFDSPIARREGWADARRSAAGPLAQLDPRPAFTILASRVDWADGLDQQWELALVALDRPVAPEAIAEVEGGAVDSADAVPLVWSPRGLFFVPFGPEVVGIYAPVDRQGVLRWATAARRRSDAVVSEYLRRAQRAFQGEPAQVLLAFDLSYLASPAQLRPHLERSAAIDPAVDDLGAIAEALAGVRGATLTIEAADDLRGELRFDFSRSTAPLARSARPLLDELLGAIGAEIDDFRFWSTRVEDRSISFRGPVSTSMARRLGSLLALPTAGASGASPGDATAGPDAGPADPRAVGVEATRRYFDSVTSLIDDLSGKADSQRRIALWCRRYADKVDHLPILGVDPELIAFGAEVAVTLRNLATIAEGGALNIAARGTTEAAISGGAGIGFYGFGYGMSVEGTSRAAVSRISRQETTRAIAEQSAIWLEMRNRSAAMRRTLTRRYGVEF